MEKIEKTSQSAVLSPELKKQLSTLNARVANVNLSVNDLLREMDNTLNATILTIAKLQQEIQNKGKP